MSESIPPNLKILIGNSYVNACYGELGNRLDYTEAFVTHMSIAANILQDRIVIDLTKIARQHLHNARDLSHNEEDRPKAVEELSSVLISLGRFVFMKNYGTVDTRSFNPAAIPKTTETPK